MDKHSVSRLCYLFARLDLFFCLSLNFFLLPFSSLVLPTSTALSVHIVGSLTPKLPSWDFDGGFFGISTGFQRDVYGFPLDSYGILMGFV